MSSIRREDDEDIYFISSLIRLLHELPVWQIQAITNVARSSTDISQFAPHEIYQLFKKQNEIELQKIREQNGL